MPAGEIRLGGRLFSLVNYAVITSLNEHYVMKLMRETGLDRVLPEDDGLPLTEEITASERAGRLTPDDAAALRQQRADSDTAYFNRLQQAIVDTLRLHELLAGYMLPAGKTEADWSLEMARDTAKHLQGLQSAEDRDEIHRLSTIVVFDFFQAGVDSLRRSHDSLSRLDVSATPTPTETRATASANGAG